MSLKILSLHAKHSRYFRDALVRANYTNLKKGIYADRLVTSKRRSTREWEEQLRRLIEDIPSIHYEGSAKTGEWKLD